MTEQEFTQTASLALLLMVFIMHPRPSVVAKPVTPVETFTDKWDAVPPAMAKTPPVAKPPRVIEIAKKQDQLPIEPAVTIVKTIPITLPEPPPPPVQVEPEETPPPARRARTIVRTASLDVCARHKMRKVIVNGGRSWRCRR